jgi:hypothetical protein
VAAEGGTDHRRGRARTNSNKAAGPVARVPRDLLMPAAIKLLAKPEKMAWQVDYRIDRDAAGPVEEPAVALGDVHRFRHRFVDLAHHLCRVASVAPKAGAALG